MLHMINSEVEVYNPFSQTGTQPIQQHGYPVTLALLKEGRKGSPQPFMTQSFVLKAQTILDKDEGQQKTNRTSPSLSGPKSSAEAQNVTLLCSAQPSLLLFPFISGNIFHPEVLNSH